MVFFELLSKKIGLSRIGRFPRSKVLPKSVKTPNVLLPLNKELLEMDMMLEELIAHQCFIVSELSELEQFIRVPGVKAGSKVFVYHHAGTFDVFRKEIDAQAHLFNERILIPIIPFNVPSTSISKEFAEQEIDHYLAGAKHFMEEKPEMIVGLTLRVFNYPELVSKYITFIQKHKNIKLINFLDLFDNFHNYRGILRSYLTIKRELDNNLIIIASGRILPRHYPMLIYLGVDLIDPTFSLYLASEDFYDAIEHELPIYKVRNFPCPCAACRGELKAYSEDKHSSKKTQLTCFHNLITASSYMKKVKQYLRYEDYRSFVEQSTTNEMNAMSMLKIMDKDFNDFLSKETPITEDVEIIKCLGPSSYYRPDFLNFQERLVERFAPEPWTRLILLLPCSAKKPYSESKSHKQFYNATRKFPEFPSFQEIILTSPLGAIPRQLEDVYPVNSYDISVTGFWDQEEIKIATNQLIKLLKKYDTSIPIICHLEGGYLDIARKAEKAVENPFYYVETDESLTANNSLTFLENLINSHKDDVQELEKQEYDPNLMKTWTRKFLKILDYQFGTGAGLAIIPNGIRTKRDRTDTRITMFDLQTKKNLGSFKRSTAQIELSLAASERIQEFHDLRNYVVFDGEKLRGSTLFRPGVTEVGEGLRPGEPVFIFNAGKTSIIATGMLSASSNSIQKASSGRVVKIKNKLK